MKRELAFHNNIHLVYRDASGNSEKQIQQIKELANDGIDLLIVSPNEVDPLTPIIQKVYDSGIPVVVVDRRTDSKKYTAFVGASNFEVGQNAGRYAVALLKGKGNIMEVTGLPNASPVIDRHKGFMDIISHYPKINYVKRIDVNSKPFLQKQEEAIKSIGNLDLIYAQNDFMALDVYKICKKLGVEKKIKIIGIDGLPTKGDGLDMVANKFISATVLYPTGGQEAIQTAVNILENKPYHKENQLATTVIDSSNVRITKLQSGKILSQQKDIERQQNVLDEQIRVYKNQKIFNNILTAALLLVLILGIISFFSWRRNKRITQKLQLQNEEISRQSEQLIEISARAEQAHQAKLNFFTNISHEFRTPLTLIFAPLGELISNSRLQYETRQGLQLIQRNVTRLYRLVNQLMDFRKIEFRKMKLHVSENDLVSFTHEIVDSFGILAKNKNIDLEFLTSERNLNVWFDPTMIDKVIFNILSNAFKFTKEFGNVYVAISKDDENAIIKIEDNGVGMTQQALDHAFEPFFQGEYENYKGTGLGLALSKELIELHKGSIVAKSERTKGCLFEIKLPLGKSHFQEGDFGSAMDNKPGMNEGPDLYITDLYHVNNIPAQNTPAAAPKLITILVIEDNNEMREYLRSRLGKDYTIMESGDGNKGLQLAFEHVPDLILCDIVIPGKNGLELTQIFKNDIRTSHIPVILLTAKDQENQKIEGMETQADAYITKPFNLLFLQKTIKSLLQNRAKIKDHYSGEIFSEEKLQVSKKADRKFIIEFTAIVESNFSNDKFGVSDICNEMGISRVQLYRKVKSLLNCNVNDYIVNTRLQKAKYYMQHEEYSISEVAFMSGFSSAAYFSTVFKSKFGRTPSAFKEK